MNISRRCTGAGMGVSMIVGIETSVPPENNVIYWIDKITNESVLVTGEVARESTWGPLPSAIYTIYIRFGLSYIMLKFTDNTKESEIALTTPLRDLKKLSGQGYPHGCKFLFYYYYY